MYTIQFLHNDGGNGRNVHVENRKEGDNMMGNRHQNVIGYVACASPTDVVCTDATGNACVMSGPTQAMKTFLVEIDPHGRYHIVSKSPDVEKF